MDKFHAQISDQQAVMRKQDEDIFDPTGVVDWGSNSMGGFLT